MKKVFLLIFSISCFLFFRAQQPSVCPNGDMESINSCWNTGVVFSYWSDGCTDPWINPSPISFTGNHAMLITNDTSVSAPVTSQDFNLTGTFPGCISFAAKIDLNAGDTVKVEAYMNCNYNNWVRTASWYYTSVSATNVPYTIYQISNGTPMLCLTGMDSMRIVLTGGKIMNGTTPTYFYIDEIMLDCTTGLEENNKTNRFTIFPNPASSFLKLSFQEEIIDAPVSLYSVSGMKVAECLPVNGVIDVSNLPAGIYTAETKISGAILRKNVLILP